MENNKSLFYLLSSGPRNITAYQIATMLRDGDIKSAKSLYSQDGDKVALTIYQPEIQKILGCRLHGNHNCIEPFCRQNKIILNKY